jgi:hypothetical protein
MYIRILLVHPVFIIYLVLLGIMGNLYIYDVIKVQVIPQKVLPYTCQTCLDIVVDQSCVCFSGLLVIAMDANPTFLAGILYISLGVHPSSRLMWHTLIFLLDR